MKTINILIEVQLRQMKSNTVNSNAEKMWKQII